jgi:hypothetical protein
MPPAPPTVAEQESALARRLYAASSPTVSWRDAGPVVRATWLAVAKEAFVAFEQAPGLRYARGNDYVAPPVHVPAGPDADGSTRTWVASLRAVGMTVEWEGESRAAKNVAVAHVARSRRAIPGGRHLNAPELRKLRRAELQGAQA